MPNSEDIMEANRELREDITALRSDIKAVAERESMTRILAYILVSVVIVLTALGLWEKADRANDQANQNAKYSEQTCQAGNKGRAAELTFWLMVIDQNRKDNPDKKTAKILDDFETKLRETYPQVDCSKVKDGERVVITPGSSVAALANLLKVPAKS